jgi:Tfp pilus tip-associated adhesin PilY1
VDLPAGEQVINQPSIGFGALVVVANKTGTSDCSASSRMYVFDVLSGGKFAGVDFVGVTLSESSNSTRAELVRTTNGEIRALVSNWENAGTPPPRKVSNSDPVPPSKNAWREIRR